MRRSWFFILTLICAYSMPANAERARVSPYTPDEVWKSAVRLLRVDYGFEVTDRDREAGYVLFTYDDDGKQSPGSIEVIAHEDNSASGTRIAISITRMPNYIEAMVMEKLERRLRADYGRAKRRAPSKARPSQDEPPNDDEPAAKP